MQRGEAADDDDGRDRGDRQAAARAAPLGGRADRAPVLGATAASEALLEHRRAGGGADPALLDRLAARPDSLSSSIAWLTHGVSGESFSSSAPQVSPPGALNWPTIFALGHLRGGEVERGRQVDDDRVDLLLLERGHDVVGVVEDLRLARSA